MTKESDMKEVLDVLKTKGYEYVQLRPLNGKNPYSMAQVDNLIKHLDEGWSISYSIKMAKITARQYTRIRRDFPDLNQKIQAAVVRSYEGKKWDFEKVHNPVPDSFIREMMRKK